MSASGQRAPWRQSRTCGLATLMRWSTALAAVAVLAWAGAPVAQAQTTPLCPPSLAPVKGGLGDRGTLGLDDGARGSEAAYEPGELIVVLRSGRTAADLRCVADELDAIVIDGGLGRQGLGGLRNAAILQLRPGVSVRKTAEWLLAPRYRRLVLAAHPNGIAEVERNDNQRDPTVADPLFKVQWGLSLEPNGLIPVEKRNPFPVAFAPPRNPNDPNSVDSPDLVEDPFASRSASRRYSMRVRQAWGLLGRRALAPAGLVRVAIVDDSLVQHADLDAYVAADGNARYSGAAKGIAIELTRAAGATDLAVTDEWGVNRTLCRFAWDTAIPAKRPSADRLAAIVASQTDRVCVKGQDPTTWRVKLDGAFAGSMVFTYGNQVSQPVDVAPLWQERGDRAAVLASIEQTILRILNPSQGSPAAVAATIRDSGSWDAVDTERELRIVLYNRPDQLGVDSSRLVSQWGATSKVSRDANGQPRQDANSTTWQTGVTYGFGGTFRIAYAVRIQNPIGIDPPLVWQVATGDLDDQATKQTVEAELNAAAVAAGIAPADLRFEVGGVRGAPRVFRIKAIRPTGGLDWISGETFAVVGANGIQSKPIVVDITRYAPRGTLVENRDGSVSIRLAAVPPIQQLAGAPNAPISIGLTASAEAVERIPAARKWPGQMEAGARHGQFIAGVIGATGGNAIGMVGVLGDQSKTRTNVRINGLVATLATDATLTMLEYADEDLQAEVVNLSLGTSANGGADLFDAGAAQQRRNHVLRVEDPIPVDAENLLMGRVSDRSRTLFVVAAGNDGADIRRPDASIRAQRKREGDRAVAALKEQNPQASKAEIDQARVDAELAAVRNGITVGLFPCRPKGMGITRRPDGIGAQQRDKGGTLSMLQMPDGTYDRGNILCVAAADWNGELADYSNWGPGLVDVAAPGSHIVGTSDVDGAYRTSSGTSYAAPMVAGVAAMVYGVVPDAQPWLVKCAILSSATSKPLRPADPSKEPFTYLTEPDDDGFGQQIPYPKDSPLTVNGMVQASEAISAALHLRARVATAQRTGSNWPTCVQKRGFFGGWGNTPVLSGR